MAHRNALRTILAALALVLAALGCAPGGFGAGPSEEIARLDPSLAPAYLVAEAAQPRATLFDRSGGVLAVFRMLPWDVPLEGRAGPVGPVGVPPASTALAFFETASEGVFLTRWRAGEAQRVMALGRPAYLLPCTHAPCLVFSETPTGRGGQGALHRLVLVDLSDPAAAQVQVLVEQAARSPGEVLLPMAIRMEGRRAAEVFYCEAARSDARTLPPPCQGLHSVDTARGEVAVRIEPEAVALGISADAGLVALVRAGEAPPQVELRALDSGARVIYGPQAGAQQVGPARFSPLGTRVAWSAWAIDAQGAASFEVVLACSCGGATVRVSGAQVGEALGGAVDDLRPAGWLDEQQLLLQAVVDGEAAVLRVRDDGSGLRRVTPGVLLGFVWP